MVRRTKEEARATRQSILDAAERLFQSQGVSRTSLQDIATAAGVTRGAVYWHFTDKSDLFNAMMDRVLLPMEGPPAAPARAAGQPELPALRLQLVGILERIAAEEQLRRVLDIALHKIEYVDELVAVRDRRLQVRHDYRSELERRVRAAQRRGELATSPPARQVAIGLHALLDGLILNWMLDPGAFDLCRVGARSIDVHLAGLAPRAS